MGKLVLKVASVVLKVVAPDRCEGGVLLETGVLPGLPWVVLESL